MMNDRTALVKIVVSRLCEIPVQNDVHRSMQIIFRTVSTHVRGYPLQEPGLSAG